MTLHSLQISTNHGLRGTALPPPPAPGHLLPVGITSPSYFCLGRAWKDDKVIRV